MADLDPSKTATTPAPAADFTPMTRAQAEQVLVELKAIQQNLLWLLLGGFFAARSSFFHY